MSKPAQEYRHSATNPPARWYNSSTGDRYCAYRDRCCSCRDGRSRRQSGGSNHDSAFRVFRRVDDTGRDHCSSCCRLQHDPWCRQGYSSRRPRHRARRSKLKHLPFTPVYQASLAAFLPRPRTRDLKFAGGACIIKGSSCATILRNSMRGNSLRSTSENELEKST